MNVVRLPQPVRCRKCRGTFGTIFGVRFYKGRKYHGGCLPKHEQERRRSNQALGAFLEALVANDR